MTSGCLSLTFPATADAVRQALRTLCDDAFRQLTEAERSSAQIVLAEALNNVVEHAYGGARGQIALDLSFAPDGLKCLIADDGAGMPGGRLPEGIAPCPDCLPEGGFGWFLIRSLSRDLDYRRIGTRNELRFRLPRAI